VESRKAPMEIKVCGGTLKVSGFIKNTPCQFVVDTGADVTTLSYRVFHKLDSTAAVKTVSTDGVIRGLDGQIIPVIGRVALEVTLG
jgi:type 1 fimbria pilin